MTREEALAKIEALHPDEDTQEALSVFIPELQVSEDERIKKCVKILVNGLTEEHFVRCGASLNEINAWLEKQDEQKPAEPRFKDGDIIKHNKADIIYKVICKAISVDSRSYYVENITTGGRIALSSNAKQNYHLWTINDAKDGDVLYTSSTASNEVFIFKKLSKEGNIECYCSYDSEDKYCEGKYHFIGKPTFKTHPATKEQRDLLFQKMKEAGYKWDAMEKELKEIKTPEYVDLGLPSGTLWRSANEEGYFTYDEAVERFGNQLPTKEQWEELKDTCSWEWKKTGYEIAGPNGKSIFLPVMGYNANQYTYDEGTDGYYWSRTYGNEFNAYCMYFDSDYISMDYNWRRYGESVRLVKGS